MKKALLLSYFLLVSLLINAQGILSSNKLSPYTNNFITDMKETTSSTNERRILLKSIHSHQINTKEYVFAYIYLADKDNYSALKKEGVKINSHFKDIITAIIPTDKLESVAALPEVKYLQMGTPVSKRMNKARVTSKVQDVQNGLAPLNAPFYGKDVVVGIIDGGFEYGHPNFYNSDKTALRIKRVWEQSNKIGTPPATYNYGVEYKSESEILTAITDENGESHGTHVTGIAAGGDKSNNNLYYGIAGEADIVLVSYGNTDANITDAIKYIYDYAASVNKPCVINMSLGTHIGPHDGTSTIDELADQLQGKGRLLVGAAGNEGDMNIHASKTFNANDTELKTFLELTDDQKFYCDIWGEAGKSYTVQLIAYDKTTQKIIFTSPATKSSTTLRITSANGGSGRININANTNPNNNKLNILISSNLSSINPNIYFGIIIKATEGTVNAWTHDYYCNFTNLGLADFYNGDTESTNDEIGGTGKKIISVGSYTSNNRYTNIAGSTYGTYESINLISSFSSKGPTVDGRMKPEICAPGSIIVSSVSNLDTTYPETKKIKKTTFNSKDYYYGVMQGTSMASPYVTGVLATWLEENPDLTPEKIRDIFSKTAINDFYTGNIRPFGNNTWGQGKIDAFAGILGAIEAYKQSTSTNEMFENNHPILIYPSTDNSALINILFTVTDKNVQISVINMNGQKVMNKQLSEVTSKQEDLINLDDLPKGIYLIKVSGEKFSKVSKIVR